jgi:hypothetical protein
LGEERGGTGASFGEDTGTCPSARVGLAMNDSCEWRVNLELLAANQVIPLETPKVFLQSALALTVDRQAADVGLKSYKPNKMSS